MSAIQRLLTFYDEVIMVGVLTTEGHNELVALSMAATKELAELQDIKERYTRLVTDGRVFSNPGCKHPMQSWFLEGHLIRCKECSG